MEGDRMSAHEDDELLINQEQSTSKSSRKKPSSCCSKRRTFIIEPLLALYIISAMPLGSIRSQFLYKKVEESMGVGSSNFSSTGCAVNMSDPGYILEQMVQAKAANWNMYIHLASFLPSMVMTVFFGIYSDQLGRRITFIMPAIGSLLSTLADMAIITFDLPLPFFFLEVIEYFFGGINTLFMGAFAYIADTVDSEKRAIRMTFIDCIFLLGGAVGELIVGFLIKAQGFLPPLYYVAIGKITVLIYAIFFVPESIKTSQNQMIDLASNKKDSSIQKNSPKGLTLKNITDGFMLYLKDNGTSRRWKLNVLLASYVIADVFSTYRIMTLYELDSPLCWDSVLIGYFGAVSMVIKCIMSFFAAFFLRKCNISEAWIVVIARAQSVAEYLYLAFVTTTVMMFFAPAIGCLSFLAIPMTRALMSKMVGPDEQGALFAVMMSCASLASLVSTLAVNKTYAATLLFFKGFTFLFAGGVLSISLTLVLIYIGFSGGFRKLKYSSGLSIQA